MTGVMDDPQALHHVLAGYSRQRRFQRGYLIGGIDFVSEHPLETVFSLWGMLVVFNVFQRILAAKSSNASSLTVMTEAANDSFQALAWTALVVITVSSIYKWARGPKKSDPESYRTYLEKLDDYPVESFSDQIKQRVATHPFTDELEAFVTFHNKQIAYLSDIDAWESIGYLMGSLRSRFSVLTNQAVFYFRVARYVFNLRSHPSGLHAGESPTLILKRLLKNWLQQENNPPSEETALIAMSFLTPNVKSVSLLSYMHKDRHHVDAFNALNKKEQEQLISHLSAGGLASQLVLVAMLMNIKTRLTAAMKNVVKTLKYQAAEDEETNVGLGEIVASILRYLIVQDDYDLDPEDAYFLCCRYSNQGNVLANLAQIYRDLPDLPYEKRTRLSGYLIRQSLEYIHALPKSAADKAVMLIGPLRDVNNFLSELLSEDIRTVHRDAGFVSFYLHLMSVLTEALAEDRFSLGDETDGLRGQIFQIFIDGVSDLGKTEFLLVVGREIASHYVFFFLRSIMSATNMQLSARLHYFHRLLRPYSDLIQEKSPSAILFRLHKVAVSFHQEHGAADLLLRWVDCLIQGNDPVEDGILFDLLIGVESDQFSALVKAAPGRRKQLLMIMKDMSERQWQAYLQMVSKYRALGSVYSVMVFRSLCHAMWAAHLAERPDRIWQLIVKYWQTWPVAIGDVNICFDQMGFIESAEKPYRSSQERFWLLNPMMAYLIAHPEIVGSTKLFQEFRTNLNCPRI